MEPLFCARQLVENKKKNKIRIYKFRKGLGFQSSKGCFFKRDINEKKVPKMYINLIQNIYIKALVLVSKNQCELTENFNTEVGVHQGYV